MKTKCYVFVFFESFFSFLPRNEQEPDRNFYVDFFLLTTAVAPSFMNFKRQPHKMVKHTQTIRRQLECVWPLCGIGA